MMWNQEMNTFTRRAGWREKSSATVFSVIFFVASALSWWSTGTGMLSVFFPGHIVLALTASFVVQMTEAAHAGRKKSAGFVAALVISVFLSSVQFTDVAYTTPVFSSLAQSALNSVYSVELLPDIQQKLSGQMKNVRSSVFGQLDAIAAELDAAPDAGSSQSVVDRGAILAHYEQQSDSYPADYMGDGNFRTLISVLDLIEQGQQNAAEQTIPSAIANLDAVRGRTASHRRLYADIRTDLAALQISLASHDSTDTAVIHESISTLRSQMMQQTEDSDLITASCDDLIAAALRAGLNADYANLSELRSNAVEYVQLLSLSTSINDRTAQQPHLAQQIAQAAALPDEEEVWQQIRTVYSSVFNNLRAELAASPLDGKADLLAKIDTTTKKYLSSQTLLSKFFVVANPMNADLSASFPSWISILLALALDLSATAAATAAANIRRHSSERMLTFTDAEQTHAA